ncbi:unnamed protein product [Ixodes persulcatus]
MIVLNLNDLIDAFVLTEINIPSESLELFVLPGYRSFCYTRPDRRGGGIAVFVRDVYTTPRLDISFVYAESVALRIITKHASFLLMVVNRPPSSSASNFILELEKVVASRTLEQQVCVVGDFNIDTLASSEPVVIDYLTHFLFSWY